MQKRQHGKTCLIRQSGFPFFLQGKFYRRLLFAVLYLLAFSLSIYYRPRHLDFLRIENGDDVVRKSFVFYCYRTNLFANAI